MARVVIPVECSPLPLPLPLQLQPLEPIAWPLALAQCRVWQSTEHGIEQGGDGIHNTAVTLGCVLGHIAAAFLAEADWLCMWPLGEDEVFHSISP